MKKEELLINKLDDLLSEMKKRSGDTYCKFFYTKECLSVETLLSKLAPKGAYGWMGSVPGWVFEKLDFDSIGGHELKGYVRKIVGGINHLINQSRAAVRRQEELKNQTELEF